MQRSRGEALANELGDSAQFQFVEVRQEEHVQAAVALAVDTWGGLIACSTMLDSVEHWGL